MKLTFTFDLSLNETQENIPEFLKNGFATQSFKDRVIKIKRLNIC